MTTWNKMSSLQLWEQLAATRLPPGTAHLYANAKLLRLDMGEMYKVTWQKNNTAHSLVQRMLSLAPYCSVRVTISSAQACLIWLSLSRFSPATSWLRKGISPGKPRLSCPQLSVWWMTSHRWAAPRSTVSRSDHDITHMMRRLFLLGVWGQIPMLNLLSGVYFSIANNGWITRLARTGLLNATIEQSELNGWRDGLFFSAGGWGKTDSVFFCSDTTSSVSRLCGEGQAFLFLLKHTDPPAQKLISSLKIQCFVFVFLMWLMKLYNAISIFLFPHLFSVPSIHPLLPFRTLSIAIISLSFSIYLSPSLARSIPPTVSRLSGDISHSLSLSRTLSFPLSHLCNSPTGPSQSHAS